MQYLAEKNSKGADDLQEESERTLKALKEYAELKKQLLGMQDPKKTFGGSLSDTMHFWSSTVEAVDEELQRRLADQDTSSQKEGE